MKFRNILVPVTGIKADEETIRLACRLAKKVKGRIYVIYIIKVKRSLPLDLSNTEVENKAKRGEEILKYAENIADEQDYEVETELLQAREVEIAVVNESVGRDIDLIIMGIGYEEPFGQFSIGEMIPYVLKNAPCQVLIYREKKEKVS
jgi:nucleotide-binding universal stress UspA family protein